MTDGLAPSYHQLISPTLSSPCLSAPSHRHRTMLSSDNSTCSPRLQSESVKLDSADHLCCVVPSSGEAETCVSCGYSSSNLAFLCGNCRLCWTCKVINKATRCSGKPTHCHLMVTSFMLGSNNWDTEYFEDKCNTCAARVCLHDQPIAATARKPQQRCARCRKMREADHLCHLCAVCIECSVYWPVKKQVILLRDRLPMDLVRALLKLVWRPILAFRTF